VIALAASLTLSEWLRGHLLSAFHGMRSLRADRAFGAAQTASLIGLWG